MKDFTQMHANQENIFHTPVWGFMFNDSHYQAMDYRDYVIELAQNQMSAQKSNFGGWQSEDDLHTHPIFREFCGSLLKTMESITCMYTNKKVQIQSMWANINDKYNYNAHHTHEGILSGVFYLHVPENSGRLILVDPAVRNHNSVIKNSNYGIKPERLACIVFPSWLEHYVEPNQSDEYRISISFNIGE
jgi:uncharacterized protein (TIGR02466 family)